MATQRSDIDQAQDQINAGNKDVQIINGQVYTWQPTNVPQDAYSYQNVDPLTGQPRLYDPNGEWWGPDDGRPGNWVPASYQDPNGQLGRVLGKMALYTSGGEYALGALGAGGAGAAAAGSGSSSAPAMTGVVAPGTLATGGTTIGAGGLASGAGAGLAGAGATAPTLAGVVAPGTVATGLPTTALTAPTTLGSVTAATPAAAQSTASAATPAAVKTAGTVAPQAAKSSTLWSNIFTDPKTVSALIGAGVSAYTAKKASDAEQKAADQALAVQKEMYDQTRADLAPWRNAGGQAATTLGALMGFGSPGVAAPAIGSSGMFQRQVGGPSLPGTYQGQAAPRAAVPSAAPIPSTDTGATLRTVSGYGDTTGGGGGTVTLLSPDGRQVKAVAPELVDHYLALGARRV